MVANLERVSSHVSFDDWLIKNVDLSHWVGGGYEIARGRGV